MKWIYFLNIIITGSLYGQSLGFTLHGMLTNHPYWVNGNNTEISTVDFSFNDNISSTAASNVDSNSTVITIISDDESGASLNIILTRPSNCSIGSQSINNSHVHIVKDNTVITSNQTLTFMEGVSSTLKLRFSSTGLYGDKHGAVNCSAGLLTYSY